MDRYSQHQEQKRISLALRRSRHFRTRLQKRRRRSALFATGAVLAGALAFEFSVASFGGMSVAEAAANQAKSLMALLDARSPGVRTAGELTKTKHKRVLAERETAPKGVPKNLAEVLAAPISELGPLDISPPSELATILPPSGDVLVPPAGGGVIFPPPGGGVLVPPGGGDTPPGGGDNPPGGGDQPPGGGDTPPPALPEPGTWMTMILGFGLIGWALRRSRAALALS